MPTARRRSVRPSRSPLELLEGRVLFATFTWDGGGGDANWHTAANWASDVAPTGGGTDALVFPTGAAQLTNVNDYTAGTSFASISFTGAGYSVSGNALSVQATGISSSGGGTNALADNVTLLANSSINVSDASTFAVSGNINNGGFALTVNPALSGSNVNLSGVISGSGTLTKNGAGSARFAGASTFSGATTLSGGGNTYANNTTGSAFGTSNVTNTSGTLRGTGSFTGTLANNDGLAPGSSSGATSILGTGGITFGVTGSYGINVNGTTAGTDYDRLNVTGVVNLDNGHALNVTASSLTAVGGEKIFIITNDGNDAVQGAFASLEDPANDTIEINGVDFSISYTGDSATNSVTGGNDVVLYVNGLNQAPVNSVPSAQTTNEDTAKAFSAANGNAITVSDADAGLSNVQVALSVNAGAKITLPSTSFVSAGANNSGAVTLTGTTSQINSALDGMSVTPATNSTSTVTLTVVTNDLGHTGSGGSQTDTDTVTISVSPVNDAPVNTIPATQTTPQNVAKVFSAANGNAMSIADIDAGGGTVQVALTATNGTVTLNGSSGISIDAGASGTSTVTFSGTISAINAVLDGASFTPTNGFIGAGTLQIVTNDQGNSGSGGALSDTDTLTINAAPAGTLAFSATTYSIAEDAGTGIATITVARTGGSAGPATVQYATSDGTAAAGSDYSAASGTLSFADGETSKTFNVPITDDSLDEDDETVNLTLSNATGAALGSPASATLTIGDNDAPPSLSIGDVNIAEGNSGTSTANFTVTLSAASGRTVTVNYATLDGSATAGSDYTAASGTLTFTPGQTSKTIPVTIIGDATQENNETFALTLSGANNATISRATATGQIVEDDAAGPTLSFASDITVNEGNSGTTNATFTVNLISPSGSTVTVDYATVAGSATEGVDYVATTGTLTFTSGQISKTVNVPVIGDTLNEDNETFALVLSNQSSGVAILDGAATATILDNDAASSISIADATAAEGTGTAGALGFVVSLSAPSGKTVTANYSTSDLTAVGTLDYVPTSGTVTFAPGETSKTINVATIPDANDEADETLAMTLSSVSNAVVSRGQATGTITDDDAPPTVSINDVTVAEPSAQGTSTASFTVSLSAASGKTVSINYATLGGTAVEGVDYSQASGTLTFAPGETSKTVSVTVNFDTEAETDETFTVLLSSPSNATIGTGTGTGTIQNTAPDAPPVAADDNFTLAPGQAYADLNVQGNDSDSDNDTLISSIATNPVNGTATVNADQTIRYTPNLGYSGADSFTYSISDGRGGTATATVTLGVTGNGAIVNPTNPKKQDLYLAATAGDDQLQLVKSGKKIKFLINGQEQGMFSANGNIVISGGAGNDTLSLKKIAQPVLFNGGDGDDIVVGGSKGNILIGGPGNDNLVGGGGRDIIIGGDGADTLSGLGGSDILISGTTIYDADTLANRAALNDLLTELAGKDKYAVKLAKISSSTGVGGSGARLTVNETTFDDGDVDTLNSGASQDFYVADTNGIAADVLIKKAKNESVIEL